MKEQKFFMNGIFRDTPEGPWPYATRCKKCGATFFPAEQICNQCLSEDMEQFNLPKYGTLYTYTVLYRPVNAYPVPHCICEIDYPEEKLLVKGIKFNLENEGYQVTTGSDGEEAVALAARILREGGLVGLPTETVYGLGANALDESAVRAIFAAKGRPADNPLIVHVPAPEDAVPLCHISPAARALMERFCPGPLTLLMPKKPCVPDVVNAGLPSVAVRIPSHPVAQRVLRACGVPVAAPSANTSGKPSPTTALHVYHDLKGKLPLILDGGECQVGLESTVVDMTGDIPTVLRPGGITPEMLLEVLPEVRVADSVLRPLREGERALSPGMRYRHYAPGGELTLVKGSQENVRALCLAMYREAVAAGRSARILAFEEHLSDYEGAQALSIGSLEKPETVAHRLFNVLRQMDEEGVEALTCEVLPAEGIGLAIMNRLSRAAAFRIRNADEEAAP